jgi:hypothetical protein
MTCKLCLAEKELWDSHIIPEFQYKPLYDEKHRFFVISTDPEKDDFYEQKGFREKLLCQQCETKFSRWETYANKVIFGKEAYQIERVGEFVRVGGVSYHEFKLYLLSLLWRMSISTLKYFSAVSLGPHEEKIRLCLLNENPGKPIDYPCFITAIQFQGHFKPDWIFPPVRSKVRGVHCYAVVVSGILYEFFITKKPLPINAEQVAINEQENFLMAVSRLEEIPFLYEILMQHSKAQNERKKTAKQVPSQSLMRYLPCAIRQNNFKSA